MLTLCPRGPGVHAQDYLLARRGPRQDWRYRACPRGPRAGCARYARHGSRTARVPTSTKVWYRRHAHCPSPFLAVLPCCPSSGTQTTDRKGATDADALPHRPHSRLNSCTNRSIPTSRPRPTTPCPRYTIPFHKRTVGKSLQTIFTVSSRDSKSCWAKVGRRRGWRRSVSSPSVTVTVTASASAR